MGSQEFLRNSYRLFETKTEKIFPFFLDNPSLDYLLPGKGSSLLSLLAIPIFQHHL